MGIGEVQPRPVQFGARTGDRRTRRHQVRLCLIAPASGGKTAAVEGGNAGMLLFGIDQPRPLDPQSTFGIAYGGGIGCRVDAKQGGACRSEEHTSELQSLMRISYAVFCLKKKKTTHPYNLN